MRGEQPLVRDQEPQNGKSAVETGEMEEWAETDSQRDRQVNRIMVMLPHRSLDTGHGSYMKTSVLR